MDLACHAEPKKTWVGEAEHDTVYLPFVSIERGLTTARCGVQPAALSLAVPSLARNSKPVRCCPFVPVARLWDGARPRSRSVQTLAPCIRNRPGEHIIPASQCRQLPTYTHSPCPIWPVPAGRGAPRSLTEHQPHSTAHPGPDVGGYQLGIRSRCIARLCTARALRSGASRCVLGPISRATPQYPAHTGRAPLRPQRELSVPLFPELDIQGAR